MFQVASSQSAECYKNRFSPSLKELSIQNVQKGINGIERALPPEKSFRKKGGRKMKTLKPQEPLRG